MNADLINQTWAERRSSKGHVITREEWIERADDMEFRAKLDPDMREYYTNLALSCRNMAEV
jgi:hypothetical protein